MLGVQDERGVHRAHPERTRLAAVQQVQEMPADRIVVGLDVDAPARMRVVIPVQQHRAEARHQPVGDVARLGELVVRIFRQHRAERGAGAAQYVHRVRARGNALEHAAHRGRDAAQAAQLGLVGGELRRGGQLAMHEQVGDLLELRRIGEIQDVVAAIVQVVAAPPDGAQRSVTGRYAGKGDRLLRFGRCARLLCAHADFSFANSSSSLCS